jgi:hypothetical protein
MPSVPFNESEAKRAVLTVGHGRGFVVESARSYLVITAAHCLPQLPVADPSADQERTYRRLLSPLGKEPLVTTECWFVDPVSDLAVLGPPDDQALFNDYEAYDKLMKSSAVLPTAPVPAQVGVEFAGWLLSLKGGWYRCSLSLYDGGLWVSDASEAILGGMSGSPILNGDGVAIGVISCSSGKDSDVHIEGGPNPRLIHHLPIWLEQELRSESSRAAKGDTLARRPKLKAALTAAQRMKEATASKARLHVA